MPNKYIRPGATYNGDGTTSAAAASNGAVGAWNTMAIFEGTSPSALPGAAGVISADDVIYIRCKDEGGGDIATVTQTAQVNFGNSAASGTNPITWIIDDGIIWPGSTGGTIVYQNLTNSLYRQLQLGNNHILCRRRGALVWVQAFPGGISSNVATIGAGARLYGVKIDWSARTAGGPNMTITIGIEGSLENAIVKLGICSNGTFSPSAYSVAHIIDCDIEILTPGGVLFGGNSSNINRLNVIGGRVYGAGATTGTALFATQGLTSQQTGVFQNFQFPNTISIDNRMYRSGLQAMQGMDHGVGAAYHAPWGTAESRDDSRYPVLNAVLPNSASKGWSWKLWPAWVDYAVVGTWMRHSTHKLYTQDPASKTVTLELLVATGLTNVHKGTVWIEVSYVDNATGVRVTETTEDISTTAALATSSAAWSQTSYGPTSLEKRSISLTTTGSIQKDTVVTVTLRGIAAATAGSITDIIIMCPDVVLS